MKMRSAILAILVIVTEVSLSAQKINEEAPKTAALVILFALVLFGLFVLGTIGWMIVLAVRNPAKVKHALPVFAFCLAAVCGFLWIADALRIVELTQNGEDRIWFGVMAVMFSAVGTATFKAFGVRLTKNERGLHDRSRLTAGPQRSAMTVFTRASFLKRGTLETYAVSDISSVIALAKLEVAANR
jgi:hypothetical protein